MYGIYDCIKEGIEANATNVDQCLMILRNKAVKFGKDFGDIYEQILADFECIKFNADLTEASDPKDVMTFLRDTETIKDPLGGTHSEAIGWSPKGECCGECNQITCARCPVAV